MLNIGRVVCNATHSLYVGITIPPQTDCFGTLGLFKPAEVEVQVFIVKVYRCDRYGSP